MVLLWGVVLCGPTGQCSLSVQVMADEPITAWVISVKADARIKYVHYRPTGLLDDGSCCDGGVSLCGGVVDWRPGGLICRNQDSDVVVAGELMRLDFENPPSWVAFDQDAYERPIFVHDCLPDQGYEGGGVLSLDEPQAQPMYLCVDGTAHEVPVTVLGVTWPVEEPEAGPVRRHP